MPGRSYEIPFADGPAAPIPLGRHLYAGVRPRGAGGFLGGGMSIRLLHGSCESVLAILDADSIDACVTDPPYGLNFMGKKWDAQVPSVEAWREVFRVLKPGAHLLAFGGTRTYHRMVCAIEDAGFEIRDQLAWIFGSGFPKSHNLEGAFDGWGTALKPAHEPIVLARKPLGGTVAENVQQHGTGAINIEGCRIAATGRPAREMDPKASANGAVFSGRQEAGHGFDGGSKAVGTTDVGRWPANVVHDGSDEVVALFPAEAGAAAPVHTRGTDKFRHAYGKFPGNVDEMGSTFQGDSGSAARFFYCAKASREDREDGLAHVPPTMAMRYGEKGQGPQSQQTPSVPVSQRNSHPTVKPTDLMRWLCRLITPPGGTVLDPYMGSGSTGRGAFLEDFSFIGIERDAQWLPIAEARIRAISPLFAQVSA
jgi:DNA modification methylase